MAENSLDDVQLANIHELDTENNIVLLKSGFRNLGNTSTELKY
jgi:hypothetical protein